MRLLVPSPPAWLDAVLGDFDAFLVDHAACERKASATALSFVAHYPDRTELVRACAELAVEELGHFRQVVERVLLRGLTLRPDRRDAYVRRLAGEFRGGSEPYFLDRLLAGAIVEARGCERLSLVASAHPEADIRDFYRELARSEARHQDVYADLARLYFGESRAGERLSQLLEAEARIVADLPALPALFHPIAGTGKAA